MKLRQQVISGVFWRMLERISTQGINFVVMIVLARLLSPSDFGTVALLTVFISMSNVLIEGGFGTALVQKHDVTEDDINTVFYLSLAVSIIIYIGLFFGAPLVASYYNKPILTPGLRWISLSVLLIAMNGVQGAVLSRNMLFNLSFKVSLIQTITTGIVGISLALGGHGIWALVFSSVIGNVSATVTRFFVVGWRPSICFSSTSAKTLFSFSWKIMMSRLLNSIWGGFYSLIIGKIYTSAELAYYSKGKQIPLLIMDSVNQTIASVSFPALSKIQSNILVARNAVKKVLQCNFFLVMPCMTFTAICAEPLILLLLGEKWILAIPIVQAACINYAFQPFHNVNLQVITAFGHSDLVLKLELIKKIIAIPVLILTYRHGILAIALGEACLITPFSAIANMHPAKKIINYSIYEQISDVFPTILVSVALGLTAWIICGLKMNSFATIFAASIASGLVYATLSLSLKIEPAIIYYGILKKLVFSRKHTS
jgi:teichuronic acid exporter